MKTIVNTSCIRIASFLRKLVVLKYRLMGVRIEGRVWISNRGHIDTTMRGKITIKDACVITGGRIFGRYERIFQVNDGLSAVVDVGSETEGLGRRSIS